MPTMTISQLARRSGLPATTLRYYEKAGILPPPQRTAAGYRRYDDGALARVRFLQRAKALGIDLQEVAELVRLWDGDRCEPVQDRLREQVHQQQLATRNRLDELAQLADDLERVGATIGATDACGPGCACLGEPADARPEPLPMAPERLVGAACTLDVAELRTRLAEWRGLRDRSVSVHELTGGGVRLRLADEEPIDDVTRLAAAESECCSFYRFTLTVDGPERSLAIDAGTDGTPAVRALLGLGR
jgi:DNA-binding transcriptional MerR regulator